jgi:hypothetical protein
MLQVWISVKFRIFGWTIGTVQESYVANYTGSDVEWTAVTPYADPPAAAKTLVNTNGVMLAVQADLNLGA